MIVMKFGGTSVGSGQRMAQVAERVVDVDGPAVVVVSAMGGATDALVAAGLEAEQDDMGAARARVAELRRRHEEAAEGLGLEGLLAARFGELDDLLRGIHLMGEQTPRSRALLLSFGERLSAPLVAAHLDAAGRRAEAVDARRIVVTDARHEAGQVDPEATRARARRVLDPMVASGVTPVVTGFLGATPDGTTTLLGRGGSDYSAALLGRCLDATEVWIWTDVDGILTADPRIVPDARTLERVTYREAAEMSYFGAKVVHPKTMLPVAEAGIPLRIRSTFHPDRPGTWIRAEVSDGDEGEGVKTVTAVRGQSLVTVSGRGLAGVPGAARRIFSATERVGVSVVMISQASSEQTVSLVVPGAERARLVEALEAEFALERRAGLVEPVGVGDDIAVVSVIGEGMSGRRGVSARFFEALAHTGVNVRAIAQGAGEMSISAAIRDEAVPRAVRAVHAAFGLQRTVDLFLVGAGRVGRSLLDMVAAGQADLLRERKLALRLVGVANRRRCLYDPHGLEVSDALQQLDGAPARPSDAEFLERLATERTAPVVVVDVTAGPLIDLHRRALEHGFHVVTANKRPISGSLEDYRGLVDAVRRTGARYGYETTFGAGLPVLHTLKELLQTGDAVHEVSGCFSGTLGYLCTRLQDGADLGEAVEQARDLGYTEPDPREDLSGRDVARKALIIARAMGLELEPEDVSLRPMVPGMDAGLAPAVSAHGPVLARAVAEAAARDEVLRYVARITPEGATVGMQSVPAGSAIGSLRGPDNILVFRSERYRDYPLVIRGPGAGADVTAAGVLGDVIRIASGT